MGVKSVEKDLGTGRGGQFVPIIIKFGEKWPTLLGQEHFSRDFIPDSTNLRGYFNRIKFGAAQTGCIFEVWGHCAAPDWGSRKNPWLISYIWTKICWNQFLTGQLFWIDDPCNMHLQITERQNVNYTTDDFFFNDSDYWSKNMYEQKFWWKKRKLSERGGFVRSNDTIEYEGQIINVAFHIMGHHKWCLT